MSKLIANALLFLVLIQLPLAFMFPQIVDGQEGLEEPQTVIRDSEGIKLQLVRQPQNPGTKEIYFDLVIYSLVDSDRVQVTWSVSGVSELLSEQMSALRVSRNTIHEQQALVRPRQFGVSTITARVEAFEARGTYISTATITIGSLEDGTIFPIDSQYQLVNLLIIVRTVTVVILVLYTLGVVGVVGFMKYQEFVQKDERKF